jgi:hypothetical protein
VSGGQREGLPVYVNGAAESNLCTWKLNLHYELYTKPVMHLLQYGTIKQILLEH